MSEAASKQSSSPLILEVFNGVSPLKLNDGESGKLRESVVEGAWSGDRGNRLCPSDGSSTAHARDIKSNINEYLGSIACRQPHLA